MEREDKDMAHVSHFKKADCKRLNNEYDRDEKFLAKERAKKESRIHFEETKNNYKIGEQEMDLSEQIENRFAKGDLKVSTRKDLNVMSDWVITCPREIDEPEEQKRFFETVYQYTKDRYGDENVLTGFVHTDESQPHMHLPVIPVKDGRVSSKALFDRSELQNYQRELDKKIAEEFGMSGLILNGRTKGNFTYEELKERDKAEWKAKVVAEQYEKMRADKKAFQEDLKALNERKASLDARESDLKAREANFEDRVNKEAEKRSEARSEAFKRAYKAKCDKRVAEQIEALKKANMNAQNLSEKEQETQRRFKGDVGKFMDSL